MARRKKPPQPDPGTPPPELLVFDEAQWADDEADRNFMPGGEWPSEQLLRFRRRQRWYYAGEDWSVANGLPRYYLRNVTNELRRQEWAG